VAQAQAEDRVIWSSVPCSRRTPPRRGARFPSLLELPLMFNRETTISELTRTLMTRAEEKFGKQRAVELHSEIEQMAVELHQLSTTLVEFEDEP